MKKLAGALCVLLCITMVVCGCGGRKESSGSGNRDSLRFGLQGEPVGLDPSLANEQMAWAIFYQIYDTLIFREEDGSYSSRLADKWEISEDGMKLTFWLRSDVKFHNGETLTADDVKYTVDRLLESPYTTDIVVGIKEAVVVDEHTVDIVMEHPYGAILDCISEVNFSIVNKKAVEEAGDSFNRNPVGTGPYKFVSWSNGEKINLEAFDEYYRGEPSIKDVTFKFFTDMSTAAIALETGDLDFLSHAPLADRNNLTNNEKVSWYETEINGCVFVAFNNEEGIFKDPKIRRAVSYAIDKEAVLQGAAEGCGKTLESLIPPACFGYSEDFKGDGYDLEKAKKLLAEAGYPDGFTATMKTTETFTYSKPAEIIQGQLSKIGIDLKLDKVERGTYFDDVYGSNFEITVFNTTAPVPDADTILEFYFCGDNIESGLNFSRTRNDEFDDIVKKAQVSTDQEERLELYNRANEIVRDEAIAIPLYTFMAPAAVNKDLKGVKADSLYKFYIFDYSW